VYYWPIELACLSRWFATYQEVLTSSYRVCWSECLLKLRVFYTVCHGSLCGSTGCVVIRYTLLTVCYIYAVGCIVFRAALSNFFFSLNFSYCLDLLIYGLFNNTLVSQIVYCGCYTLVWIYELRYTKSDGPSCTYSTSHAINVMQWPGMD